MSPSFVRPLQRCAWHGQSLLIVNHGGECGKDDDLSGFYFREARHLRTVRLLIDGESPWPCESASSDPASLYFNLVYPELVEFGGGGSGQSQDAISRNTRGIPHRCVDIQLTYVVRIAGFTATLCATN